LRAFLRLLLATGCRLSEAAGIAVDEIDPVAAVWRLPARRTKNRKPHMMPLPSALLTELEALMPEGERSRLHGYRLLGHTHGGALTGFGKIKAAIDAKSGVSDWRFHDLRRTVRTRLAALGVAPDIAERCLNHSTATSLEATYNRHNYEAEILAALKRWQSHLTTLVDESSAPTVVVPLRPRQGG
jgi:integrase